MKQKRENVAQSVLGLFALGYVGREQVLGPLL